MTRAKGEKRLTIGSRAVAVAIITEVLEIAELNLGGIQVSNAPAVADEIVALAWDVEITFDAGVTGADKMRSTPEVPVTIEGPTSPA